MNGNKKTTGVILALGGLCLGSAFALSPKEENSKVQKAVQAQIASMIRSKKPSQSTGKLTKGQLTNPAVLPEKGYGYSLRYPERKSNYGSDRMIFGLMEVGANLYVSPGKDDVHRLWINDISSKNGGKLKGHINHQMGLDVDLQFFISDIKGRPLRSRWMSFDEKGLNTGNKYYKKGTRRFDVPRNWILVSYILENKRFSQIRALLVANWLKKMLIEHATTALKTMKNQKERKRQLSLIEKAKKLLRQPKSSPHSNHFHLSLAR